MSMCCAKGRKGQPLSPQATKLRGLGNEGCCADRDGSKSELLKNFALLSDGPTGRPEETLSPSPAWPARGPFRLFAKLPYRPGDKNHRGIRTRH